MRLQQVKVMMLLIRLIFKIVDKKLRVFCKAVELKKHFEVIKNILECDFYLMNEI